MAISQRFYRRGDSIVGRHFVFQVLKTIGGPERSSMSAAYAVTTNRMKGIYFLKLPRPDIDPEAFKAEGEIWLRLEEHPNIVELVAIDRLPDGAPLLVLEYVLPGYDLTTFLRLRTPILTFRVPMEVLAALSYGHERHGLIAHNDIKPANILITEDMHAKLTDFGLAIATASGKPNDPSFRSRIFQDDPITSVVGRESVHFSGWIAPECLTPGAPPSATSDIYSLGLLLWQLAAGSSTTPYDHIISSTADTDIGSKLVAAKHAPLPSTGSQVFDDIASRWAAFSAHNRPQSFREALGELKSVAEKHGVLEVERQLEAETKRPKRYPSSHQRNSRYNTLFNKATAAEELDRWDVAERFLARATREDPTKIEAYVARASYLALLGRNDESFEVLSAGIVVNPKSPDLHYHRFKANLHDERFEAALADMRAACRLAPRFRGRHALLTAINNDLALSGVRDSKGDLLAQLKALRDAKKRLSRQFAEEGDRTEDIFDDGDNDDLQGVPAPILLAELQRQLSNDRPYVSEEKIRTSVAREPLPPIAQFGDVSVLAIDTKANHYRAMALLARQNLRPLWYQEVLVLVDSNSELRERLRGKSFWLAGDELEAAGCYEFDSQGRLLEGKAPANRTRKVQVDRGYFPPLFWVHEKPSESGLFTLGADWQPETELATTVVGLPHDAPRIGASDDSSVYARIERNVALGTKIVVGNVSYAQSRLVARNSGFRLLKLPELPLQIRNGLLPRLVRAAARESKGRFVEDYIWFYLDDGVMEIDGYFRFDEAGASLNEMFRPVSESDWKKLAFASRAHFSAGSGYILVELEGRSGELSGRGSINVRASIREVTASLTVGVAPPLS